MNRCRRLIVATDSPINGLEHAGLGREHNDRNWQYAPHGEGGDPTRVSSTGPGHASSYIAAQSSAQVPLPARAECYL